MTDLLTACSQFHWCLRYLKKIIHSKYIPTINHSHTSLNSWRSSDSDSEAHFEKEEEWKFSKEPGGRREGIALVGCKSPSWTRAGKS